MEFTPHWWTEQVNSISRKCEMIMNGQLFGLTQDQSAEIIIAYYFVNEMAHNKLLGSYEYICWHLEGCLH